MDRIDIHIRVPRVKYDKLRDNRSAESSFMIRERVEKARDIQVSRFANKKITSNAEMGVREIKDFCIVDSDTESILKQAVDNLSISVRGYHKILKLARTIADLENEDNIKQYHVTEAIQYRQAS